jgi:hypothetical protein
MQSQIGGFFVVGAEAEAFSAGIEAPQGRMQEKAEG